MGKPAKLQLRNFKNKNKQKKSNNINVKNQESLLKLIQLS
jgi:hypothetical protein